MDLASSTITASWSRSAFYHFYEKALIAYFLALFVDLMEIVVLAILLRLNTTSVANCVRRPSFVGHVRPEILSRTELLPDDWSSTTTI